MNEVVDLSASRTMSEGVNACELARMRVFAVMNSRAAGPLAFSHCHALLLARVSTRIALADSIRIPIACGLGSGGKAWIVSRLGLYGVSISCYELCLESIHWQTGFEQHPTGTFVPFPVLVRTLCLCALRLLVN